jgi:hypothetical protein
MMKKGFRILPDIAGVYCFVFFTSLVFLGGKHGLRAGDTFWHIKAGLTMLERHSLLTHDIFSHTAYGIPWIAHEWLAELVMAGLHQIAGLPGVVLFFYLLATFTYWLLFRLLNHFVGEGLSLFCVTVAVVLSLPHLLVRPHIFSWFFGIATLFTLLVRRDRLYLLPLFSAVWANLHGGFLFGIVLQAFFIVGFILDNRPKSPANFKNWLALIRHSQKPIIILILCVLAACLNPFGYKLFLFPFHVTKEIFINNIGEWAAPNLREAWYFKYYILSLLFLLTFNLHRINWTNRLLLIFFINSSLNHFRHISLAGLFLTPFLSEFLSPWVKRAKELFAAKDKDQKQLALSPLSGPLATLFLATSLFFVSCANPPFWQRLSPVIFPLSEKFPVQAVQYLGKHLPEGNMLNEYFIGGYLIYAMEPPPKVFIDGRADMYGEKIFGDYGKIVDLGEETDRLLAEYEIAWVIFPADRPLILYLKAGGDWSEVYLDNQVAILVRNSSDRNSPKNHKNG